MIKEKVVLAASIAMWLLAIGVGQWILVGYENSPGLAAATPPIQWPADSQIARSSLRPTLVMLIHPNCPCSRSSIGELALIMARCKDKLTTKVLFYKPTGVLEKWARTDLWRRAQEIPGVEVIEDLDGIEAQRFHAFTSGQTFLYAADGHLLFSGGITASRGHSGNNAGRSAIVSLVNNGVTERARTFVFGCSLFRKGFVSQGLPS